MTLTLPYPPSVNHYWRRARNGCTFVSRRGKVFRVDVLVVVREAHVTPLEGRLAVRVDIYPPDRRRRDVDNVAKALLDAMQYAGVYVDDEQIDRLELRRCAVEPPGRVEVEIVEIPR